MDFFNFNYKPSSFKGKTPEAILEMKSNKVDKDFFTKYNSENNEDFRELTPEMKGAMQLLIDLKHKVTIYNKCYKNSFPAEKPRSMRPAPAPAAAAAPEPEPMQEEQAPEYQEQDQQMEGGGRRRRRGTKSKSKSKSKRSSKGKSRGKRTRKH